MCDLNMSNLDPAGDALSTNAVYIPLPAYSPRDPRAWFVQVDILFECKRITSQRTKFSQVVSQLPLEIVTDLLDVIDPVPAVAPCNTLKAVLIKRSATSEEANIRQLLSGVELGDRTPSQLLRHMQHLVGGKNFDESILRQLWLQHIPLSTRQILATQHEAPLSAVAELADKIHECYPNNIMATVSHSSHHSDMEAMDARLSRIELRLDKLTEALVKMSEDFTSPAFNHRPRSSSRKGRTPRTRDAICYYHSKFKDNAKHCILPCSYVSANKQGNTSASQ